MLKLLYADKKGCLYDYSEFEATGRLGNKLVKMSECDLISLPKGATLSLVPGRIPIGIKKNTRKFRSVKKNPFNISDDIFAVAALLPQGYTRTLLPGFVNNNKVSPIPLLGYTAVCLKNNKYYVAAVKTDEDKKWNPEFYNTSELEFRVTKLLSKFKDNRIIKQLAKCSLEYGCFTAQNIFYQRWEGGIPISPSCNANCLGCISLQPSESCPSPQERIKFKPTVEEVSEIAVYHLETADEGIISFGQGCEGEPLMQGDLIINSVEDIRKKTDKGTINLNTNGSRPEIVKALAKKGLDSMRVSIISPDKNNYNAYYRQKIYDFEDVKRSLQIASSLNVYTYINLLTIPGFTDREDEVFKLIDFIKETNVRHVQIRNLNIDPDYFLSNMSKSKEKNIGISNLIKCLQEELPEIIIGNYSVPIK